MTAQQRASLSPRTQWVDYSTPNIYQSSGWPQQPTEGGNKSIGILIWTPAIALAVALAAFGQLLPAIITGALALLVHSLFQPRVAIYALVFSIPLEWMVGVMPGITTVPKLLGLYAMLLSLPRIITAAIPTNWDRSGKWMVFLILWAAISIMWSPYPNYAMLGVQSLALIWGIPVLMCVHFRDQQSVRFLMHVYLAACLLNVIAYLALSDVAQLTGSFERQETSTFIGEGVEGTSGNPNIIARDFAVAVIISFYFFVTASVGFRKVLYLAFVPLLCAGIVLTKGRAVYLGLPAAMIGALIMLGGAGLLRRVFLAVMMAIVVGIVGTIMVKFGLMGEGIVERFNSIFESGVEAGSRSTFWMQHLEQFVSTGFIGRGYRQAAVLAETSYHVAHNDWISIAGMLGVVGLVCFGAFNLSLFLRIRAIPDIWSKMFCLMVFFFMLCGGLTQDDYVVKYYVVAVGWLLCTIHLYENVGRSAVR